MAYFILGIIVFFYGASLASFFELCISRSGTSNRNSSLWRSRCESCQHPLAILDLVPVFAYLFLHGKCRYCQKNIPSSHLRSELILGSAFTLIFFLLALNSAIITSSNPMLNFLSVLFIFSILSLIFCIWSSSS